MKLRLIVDLPISTEHECFIGNEYDIKGIKCNGRNRGYWIESVDGKEILALKRECEIIKEVSV